MTQRSFLSILRSLLRPLANPRNIAKQLRHPKGKLGKIVAGNMNRSNEVLYDFTLDLMDLQPNQRILELGFGNGKFFEKIFKRAGNIRVTGVDFSELMVRSARNYNENFIDDGVLDILYSNMTALPFDANVFDKIYCINVVYFWDNPDEYLQEIFRVLKRGSLFYMTIRTPESLQALSYTQYNFNLYDGEGWKSILLRNHFVFEKAVPIKEPSIVISGKNMTFESLCLIARKPEMEQNS